MIMSFVQNLDCLSMRQYSSSARANSPDGAECREILVVLQRLFPAAQPER